MSDRFGVMVAVEVRPYSGRQIFEDRGEHGSRLYKTTPLLESVDFEAIAGGENNAFIDVATRTAEGGSKTVAGEG